MTLADDIERRMTGCVRKARINYWLAYGLLAIAVISSSLSSILVAARSEQWTDEQKAALAAVPGVIAVVMATFRFAVRAEWWWEKFHGLDSLYRRLKFEGENEHDVSKALSEFIAAINKKWPGLGDAPSGK
jgi:hypothetical protein